MKIGVFTVLFRDMPFDKVLDYIVTAGVEAVEIACGGYVGEDHCNLDHLLADRKACAHFRESILGKGLTISALSVHANPLHPDHSVRQAHKKSIENTIRLAGQLGVDTIVTFSGCPGSGPEDRYPNWVTCPWPPDFSKILRWQWEECLIPYWRRTTALAHNYGVRLAIEMHPGFCVYNPETLLSLRQAIGENIGTNFDPSHLFWQGIDPVVAIRTLGPAIFHFHAKDTWIDPLNTSINGILDTKSYKNARQRSWVFRTVGYGHGEDIWRAIISALRLAGYDGVLSIEHEDNLMSPREGFEKALAFLQRLIIRERPGEIFWS